jgi:hypothetical protein
MRTQLRTELTIFQDKLDDIWFMCSDGPSEISCDLYPLVQNRGDLRTPGLWFDFVHEAGLRTLEEVPIWRSVTFLCLGCCSHRRSSYVLLRRLFH